MRARKVTCVRRPEPTAARRAILRNAVILAVLAVTVLLAANQRFTDNPRRAGADALVERMEGLYREVRAGTVVLPREPASIDEQVSGVRTERGRWSLAGTADGTCYAMWWDQSGRRHVRTVPGRLSCDPRMGSSDDPDTVASSALTVDEDADTANWDSILPPARSVQAWWIPLLIIVGWISLSACTRIVVILVTKGKNLARWRSTA